MIPFKTVNAIFNKIDCQNDQALRNYVPIFSNFREY